VIELLQIKDLSISFDGFEVLRKVNLDLAAGETLALTGANGTGKTSLLRAVAGEITPLEGEILLQKDIAPFFVHQECDTFSGTVKEYLFGAKPEISRIYTELCRSSDPIVYAELINAFNDAGGFELEASISSTINKFGIGIDDLDFPYRNLSHGFKRILSVIRGALSGSKLLLLDEPTNHLDIEMTLKLEEIVSSLSESGVGIIVVSHDRTFIDRVAHKTVYLKRGIAISISGGYSEMLAFLEKDFLSRKKKCVEIDKKIRQLELDVARRKSWSDSREASKRLSSDKGHEGHMAAKLAKRALVVRKRKERLVQQLEQEKPFVEKPITIKIPQYEVPNRKMLNAERISFSYGKKNIFREVSLNVDTNERIGLIGPNGSGKTTLMRCLAGILKPVNGRIYRNDSVDWVYIPQDMTRHFKKKTPFEEISDVGLDEQTTRSHLANIGFRGDRALANAELISCGERMRLAILKAILSRVEFIFMDEPTNHLDIESLEMLDKLLNDFPGGFLFISHDRQFIAEHGEKIFTIEDDGLKSLDYTKDIDIDSFTETKRNLTDSYEQSITRRKSGDSWSEFLQ
jgi:ATPase subunit of ABC transporter with duplicated ATPase domains